MHRFLFIWCYLVFCSHVYGQPFLIEGTVRDNKAIPLETATVSLLQAKDSSWISSELTDSMGYFYFHSMAGKYILDVQLEGYSRLKVPIAITGNMQIADIFLVKQSEALKEIVVSSRRQYIETGQGKTVLNIAGNTNTAGANAYDMLKRSPGVTIGMDGNISMQGKQGVVVYIDDRPTYMAGKDLEDFLKSLTADNIAQLELITQPSARYDAAGNAGIINIKQKKQKKQGINGSLISTIAQSVYPYTSHNGSLNYNTGKFNLYTTGGYLINTSYLKTKTTRVIMNDAGDTASNIRTDYFIRETLSDYFLRTGVDYTVKDGLTTGVMLVGVYHPNEETDRAVTAIADHTTSTTYSNFSLADKGFIRKRAEGNVYLNGKISKDHNLRLNADYLYNKTSYRQYLSSRHYNVSAGGSSPGNIDIRSKQPFITDAISLKADYTGKVGDVSLESGLKHSSVVVDVNAIFDVYHDNWVHDTIRSNHFIYHEQISAAYISANKNLNERWKVQIGLRTEQAVIRGEQVVQHQSFRTNKLSLFPTAYIAYAANEKNQFDLNYGRRIERPHYRALNPFADYSLLYFYEKGNPRLLPAFAHNIELKHSYDKFITTTANYNRTRGLFYRVQKRDSATGGVYLTPENNASSHTVTMSLQVYKKLIEQFELTVSGMGYYSAYDGSINGEDIHTTAASGNVALDTVSRFKNGWAIQTNINYFSWQGEYCNQMGAISLLQCGCY